LCVFEGTDFFAIITLVKWSTTMTRIELTPEKAGMLREILESYLSDLRMEISATDLQDFREKLKNKAQFLRELLDQLEEKAEKPSNG
jgi:hypothetical protein